MARKRHAAEEIVAKLRQVDVHNRLRAYSVNFSAWPNETSRSQFSEKCA